MKDIKWLFNRLRAMNVFEITWRVQQKILQQEEKKNIYKLHLPVTKIPLAREIAGLQFDEKCLQMNWENQNYSLFSELDLFGKFLYEEYKSKWSAGFQTKEVWPKEEFSYDISISQRTDIGDIRTNWELNRHYQFAALAKNYYVTGEQTYLNELERLFSDWNKNNFFLHGVQWTSAMEIAIRANSWMYTYCFLKKAFQKYNYERNELLEELQHGILVMIYHVVQHRARYSSANNHLVVEMYAVALAGVLTGYEKWIRLAIPILSKEIEAQNYADGVNKEMSLHYQCFVMEAYGLLIHTMKKNFIDIPQKWYEYLQSMNEFVADCYGVKGELVLFGDNDEGKILDLCGSIKDYYKYVLDLMSTIMPMKYSAFECMHENLNWILTEEEQKITKNKNLYISKERKCYSKGGYTIVRAEKGRILLGIDHAELGFGKLAAHGHADTLSFQMFVDGNAIFVDPGTYNYHFDPQLRDQLRASEWHNTVAVEGKEQSKMLGPFLWGKRCKCELLSMNEEDLICKAKVIYDDIVHTRTYTQLGDFELRIADMIAGHGKKAQIFLLHPDCEVLSARNHVVKIKNNSCVVSLENVSGAVLAIDEYMYSSQYCNLKKGVRIRFITDEDKIETKIKVIIDED